jgi:hypothetical protein
MGPPIDKSRVCDLITAARLRPITAASLRLYNKDINTQGRRSAVIKAVRRAMIVRSDILSVKLIDNEAFYGFRVRRTINGKVFQEYFSLKQQGVRLLGRASKRVEQAALQRDRELAAEQVRSRQQLKNERCFNEDGSVRGVSYLRKTEKSGAVTPIFQVGIASELEDKIVCTSFSLNAHGKDEAWRKAIDAYAKHKVIGKNTKLYKQLLAAIPQESKK